MARLFKLGILAAAGYALWRYLTDQGADEVQPADVRTPRGSSNGGESAGSPSKAELYERAKELGVEGRSKMTKQQLERAISERS